MTTATDAPPAPGYLELYPYGHRDVLHYDADGKCVGSEMVPLTLEQVLHPEETDYPVSSARHDFEVRYLATAFQGLAPAALVTSDVPHHWGVAGLGHHRPDVAVAFGISDLRALRPKFVCDDEGTRPVLVVEVVSPSTRETDVEDEKKVGQYLRAGVEWYVIVDREEDEDEPTLIGRHLADGEWVRMELDAEGRLYLPPVDAYLRVRDGELECLDARTGLLVTIGDVTPERLARAAAERQATDADLRADAERQTREAAEYQADAERQAARRPSGRPTPSGRPAKRPSDRPTLIGRPARRPSGRSPSCWPGWPPSNRPPHRPSRRARAATGANAWCPTNRSPSSRSAAASST